MSVVGVLVAGLFLWKAVGCVVGLTVAMFGVLWVDKKISPKVGLPFSIVLALSLWFLFGRVLKVSLG